MKMMHKQILLILFILLLSNNLNAQQVFLPTIKAKEDMDQLMQTFEKVHFNPFFKYSKKEIIHRKDSLLGLWTADSVSYKAFIKAGMQLTAMMSNGHSQFSWRNEKLLAEMLKHNYLPFIGKLNKNGAFVITHSMDSTLQKGMIIRSINGVSMNELFWESMSYTGGTDAFRNAYCEKLFPLLLFFSDKIQYPFQIQYSEAAYQLHDGVSLQELASFVNATVPQINYSFQMIDTEVGLISYNSCTDYKEFNKFLKSTFKKLRQENVNKLIIDVRDNGGGDSRLNDLLLAYITEQPYRQSSGRYWKVSSLSKEVYSNNPDFESIFGSTFMRNYMNTQNGEVIEELAYELTYPKKPKYYFNGLSCVLIGPNTFSSANFLVDAIKTYQLSTLIGQASGEETNDFGELLNFELNNSGQQVFISSTYDIGADGDSNRRSAVQPDINVKEGVLEFAINWIKQQ